MTEKEMLELMKQALEPVHEKLTVLDEKVTSLDEKVNSLDAKVTSLDEKVNSLDTKVASLDAKVNSLDTKVASLDEKVNSLDTKVASLDEKVNSLDADVRGIKVVLENEVRRDLNLLAEGHFGAAALPGGEGSLGSADGRHGGGHPPAQQADSRVEKSAMRRPDRQSTPDAPGGACAPGPRSFGQKQTGGDRTR